MRSCNPYNSFSPFGAAGSITLDYIGNHSTGVDQSVYTFASVALGTPSPDRVVVIAIGSRTTTGGSDPVVSIAGIVAEKAVTAFDGGTTSFAGIYYAKVPSGAVGDVVVTFSTVMLRANIGVYSLRGATSVYATAGQYGATSGLFTDVSVHGPISLAFGAAGTGISVNAFSGLIDDYQTRVDGEALVVNAARSKDGTYIWTNSIGQWAVVAAAFT